MGGGRGRQRGQVIAALQQLDDPAAGMAAGDFHQSSGRPGEIVLVQLERRQRVPAVGVEAGLDHQQFGTEAVERRQDDRLEGGAELGAAIA